MRLLTLALLFTNFIFAASEYDGNWQSACHEDEERGTYSSEHIKIGDNKIEYSVAVFGNSDCSNQYVDVSITGTLDIGPVSQSIANARDTQAIVSKALLTPKSGFVAMMLNSKNMCGMKNWKANVAQDVSGKECEGKQMPKIGDSSYDLISRESNKLFRGEKTEENNGTSPEKRPIALNKENPFSKK